MAENKANLAESFGPNTIINVTKNIIIKAGNIFY